MCDGAKLPESLTAGPDDNMGSEGSSDFEASDGDIPRKRKASSDDDYVTTTFKIDCCGEYNYDASDDDYVVTDSESTTIQSERELNIQSAKLSSEKMVIGEKMEELDKYENEKLTSDEMGRGGKKEELDIQSETGLVLRKMKDLPEPPLRVMFECRWVKPFRGIYQVDTDGSVKKRKAGGYGAIIRNWDGELVVAASGVSDNLSVLCNQLMGVRLGLQLAIDYNLDHSIVDTNSRFIYLLVTFQRDPYEEDFDTVREILTDIYHMQNDLKCVDFGVSIRGANKAADYLSKLFKNISEIKPELHPKLIDIMASDAAGTFYECLM